MLKFVIFLLKFLLYTNEYYPNWPVVAILLGLKLNCTPKLGAPNRVYVCNYYV